MQQLFQVAYGHTIKAILSFTRFFQSYFLLRGPVFILQILNSATGWSWHRITLHFRNYQPTWNTSINYWHQSLLEM